MKKLWRFSLLKLGTAATLTFIAWMTTPPPDGLKSTPAVPLVAGAELLSMNLSATGALPAGEAAYASASSPTSGVARYRRDAMTNGSTT